MSIIYYDAILDRICTATIDFASSIALINVSGSFGFVSDVVDLNTFLDKEHIAILDVADTLE
tara:strand:+ start:1057 stop:1242 length:186 start_codon:yes stop_codon:yes gene_type:complete